jgi:hypothetical protein
MATAKELSGEEATQLIEHLGNFVSKDAKRLPVVIEWTRELILSHATFISSQTRTKLRLKPILDIINHRIADNDELVRMREVCATIQNIARLQQIEVTTPTRSAQDGEPSMRWSAAQL